jgi:atypical dual specificity phosphatase
LLLLYYSSEVLELADPDINAIDPDPCDQVPEGILRERLGRVSMMDIESSNFSWSSLTSLHHTKHTATSTDPSEDNVTRSFEVFICSIHVFANYFFTVGEIVLVIKV